jgi:nitroreductase
MLLQEIKTRRAVREYNDREVSEEDIEEIIKAGQFAPTARHNQAVEFIVVRGQETKETIFNIVGQEFVKQAKVLIIPAIDATKTMCPVQDLSVASENMFLQATALGLGTVWKNLMPEWQIKIKELLGIPENYQIINLIPVGYPKEKPAPHNDAEFNPKKMHKERF